MKLSNQVEYRARYEIEPDVMLCDLYDVESGKRVGCAVKGDGDYCSYYPQLVYDDSLRVIGYFRRGAFGQREGVYAIAGTVNNDLLKLHNIQPSVLRIDGESINISAQKEINKHTNKDDRTKKAALFALEAVFEDRESFAINTVTTLNFMASAMKYLAWYRCQGGDFDVDRALEYASVDFQKRKAGFELMSIIEHGESYYADVEEEYFGTEVTRQHVRALGFPELVDCEDAIMRSNADI